MSVYKIADVLVEMSPSYDETAHWYKPYFYSDEAKPDMEISVSDEEKDYFVAEGVDITPAIAENIVLCNKFNFFLLKYFGSYIHSSALLFDNKVYLFSASSGVGKSTHTKKWIKRFGDRAAVINDDKPSFRIIDGKCIVYGTPFAGGTDVQQNLSAELGAIVFIERAEENSIEKLSPAKSIGLLLNQSPSPRNQKAKERQLDMYSQILSDYPVYLLRCNMDDSAVDTALAIIN